MGLNRTFFSFKTPLEIEELRVIHPYALLIFAALVKYCFDVGFPIPLITSMGRTQEENDAVDADSDTHMRLGAFDVSSKAYTVKQIKDITDYLTKHYGQWGAVNSEGQIRLVVYHKTENGAFHFHFQIHRRFALPYFTGTVPA